MKEKPDTTASKRHSRPRGTRELGIARWCRQNEAEAIRLFELSPDNLPDRFKDAAITKFTELTNISKHELRRLGRTVQDVGYNPNPSKQKIRYNMGAEQYEKYVYRDIHETFHEPDGTVEPDHAEAALRGWVWKRNSCAYDSVLMALKLLGVYKKQGNEITASATQNLHPAARFVRIFLSKSLKPDTEQWENGREILRRICNTWKPKGSVPEAFGYGDFVGISDVCALIVDGIPELEWHCHQGVRYCCDEQPINQGRFRRIRNLQLGFLEECDNGSSRRYLDRKWGGGIDVTASEPCTNGDECERTIRCRNFVLDRPPEIMRVAWAGSHENFAPEMARFGLMDDIVMNFQHISGKKMQYSYRAAVGVFMTSGEHYIVRQRRYTEEGPEMWEYDGMTLRGKMRKIKNNWNTRIPPSGQREVFYECFEKRDVE